MPAVEGEADAGSEVSEWELRECREREEERRVEAEVLGRGGITAVPTHPTLHGTGGGRVGSGWAFLCLFFCSSLGAHSFSPGGPGRRAQGELATSRLARTADRKTG